MPTLAQAVCMAHHLALHAVRAARWVAEREAGRYGMSDVLGLD